MGNEKVRTLRIFCIFITIALLVGIIFIVYLFPNKTAPVKTITQTAISISPLHEISDEQLQIYIDGYYRGSTQDRSGVIVYQNEQNRRMLDKIIKTIGGN